MRIIASFSCTLVRAVCIGYAATACADVGPEALVVKLDCPSSTVAVPLNATFKTVEAIPRDAAGLLVDGASVEWRASNPALLTVVPWTPARFCAGSANRDGCLYQNSSPTALANLTHAADLHSLAIGIATVTATSGKAKCMIPVDIS